MKGIPFHKGEHISRITKAAKAATPPGSLNLSRELLEQLIPGQVTKANFEDVFAQLKRAVIERVLGGELTHHLGYAHGQDKPDGQPNYRNATSNKRVLTDGGAIDVAIPRDRTGSYEPKLIGKHERRLTGFDETIIAMYARGMTVREIQAYLLEMYAIDVSPDFISSVTDAVMSEVGAWQSRPLERMYPVVFFDVKLGEVQLQLQYDQCD